MRIYNYSKLLFAVCADWLPVNAPVLWREDCILDPLSLDVGGQLSQGSGIRRKIEQLFPEVELTSVKLV